MDLPPSGWYPDPYGVPRLLRWWDGSTWTQHTYQDGGTDPTDTAESATPVQQTTVQPTVQPTTVQPGGPPTTVQPAVQQPGAQPTTYQPAVTSNQPGTAQPTTVQPTTVQPSAVQPTTVQPSAVQPTTVQPTTVQPATAPPGGAGPAGTPPQGPDANSTQVLFLGDDAWTTPGAPGGAGQGDRDGYYRMQRRRRIWVMSGLAGGTAVALGLTALVVTTLAQPSASTKATQSTTPAAATTAPSPTPSPTPSATPSGSLIDDGTSGLSYAELATPWQPNCPSALNNTFAWDAGESAIAGQINGGQTTWYGVACSGPLPQNYGYNGVADLQNVATNLVNQFNGAYYSPLQHNFQQEVSQPLSVSGHAGWEIKFLMTYTNTQGQGLPFTDELGAVVVADLGSGIQPAVFYTSVPGNLGENNVDSLLSSLKLTVPAQPGGSGSPADGSPAAGSPAAGSPNP